MANSFYKISVDILIIATFLFSMKIQKESKEISTAQMLQLWFFHLVKIMTQAIEYQFFFLLYVAYAINC